MSVKQNGSTNGEKVQPRDAKAWKVPTVTRLRAGSAESRPGSVAFDSALDVIGS
jgi:hypothetical protein